MKTGIIYLIVNIEHLMTGVVPFLYVGSKADKEKFGTYWSSSIFVKDDIKRLGVSSFKKLVLKEIEYDNVSDLLNLECDIQEKLDVVNSPIFYNKAFADGRICPGHDSASGTIWLNKNGKHKRVVVEEVEYWLNKGFTRGRAQNYNKDRTYIHKNGTVLAVSLGDVDELLMDGWIKGRPKGNQRGKIWVFKEDEKKLIQPNELDSYISSGWTKGCFSNEEKQKLKKAEIKISG